MEIYTACIASYTIDLEYSVRVMQHCGVATFCLVILLSSLTPASTECGRDRRVVLPLGLFASSDVLRTAEALPAAELAVQQINEDSDILSGYCIQQKVFSSKVWPIALH